MIHYKRAVIPMVSKATDQIDFELIVYGYSCAELMVVPNPVTPVLAVKYPNHYSSLFFVHPLPENCYPPNKNRRSK